jgi:Ca-activated chloride channel family protein
MGRAFFLVVLAAAALAPDALTEDLRAQSPGARFRAGVDAVLLSVTVTDANQRHVTDLDRVDFTVYEEGVPQELTFFRKADVRLALALVIDSSASMEEAMGTAQEAAIGFVRQLQPGDVASVVDFDSRVRVVAEFNDDRNVLEEAIRSTVPGGSTSLYNAVYIALKELGKIRLSDEQEGLRRRAIVLLSDGEDTSSLVSFDQALDAASRADAVIYTIGLGVGGPGTRKTAEDASFVLTRLAQRTGGRAFFLAQARDLARVYRDIREELSSQYVLAYMSSSPSRGQWRRVNVRVNRAGAVVRTRQGYFAAE